MKLKLANILLFKTGWLAVVIGAAYGYSMAGTLVIAAVVAFHLSVSPSRRGEVRLLFAAALIGVVWESLMVLLDVVSYRQSAVFAPYWIVAMWVLFATTLNSSMAWLKNNSWMPVVFGALGGPLSFLAGEKIGAVQLPDTLYSVFVIGVGWAILLPLLIQIAKLNSVKNVRNYGLWVTRS